MAAKKRHAPGQIVHLLRQAEVESARGQSVARVCREPGVGERTHCRWRKEYGGIRTARARRLKDPERGNARLKTPAAGAELDKATLRAAAAGSF